MFGPGVSAEVGRFLRSNCIGVGRVFVVADRAVADAGLLSTMLAGLIDLGFRVEVFDDIEGEPDEAVTDRAAERAKAGEGAVAIVGFGGGSALDVAKLVALLSRNEGHVRNWLGIVEPASAVAPLVLIPTTSGTGAEATRIAMVTVDDKKRAVSCAQFLPLLAVLDESLVAALPAEVVATTGMDAVAHGVESMLSTNRSIFTVALATEAVQILMSELEGAVLREDVKARGRLLYAAHLSGLALNAGVVMGHSVAYVIARHAPVSHGTSCALALPYCLAYNQGIDDALAGHIARTLTDGARSSLQAGAEAVDSLTDRIGLPRSLAAVGIAESELDQMVDEIVADYPRPNNPVSLEATALRELLSYMHKGDVTTPWIVTTERTRH
ncbi:MAG: iron-containing alcohol dehydrogenase [Acidimicrobiales bacterium]